jgi:hypothetical protein
MHLRRWRFGRRNLQTQQRTSSRGRINMLNLTMAATAYNRFNFRWYMVLSRVPTALCQTVTQRFSFRQFLLQRDQYYRP